MREELEAPIVTFDESRGVGEITMNRPDSLNALNRYLREDVVSGLRLLEEQNDGREGVALRAVILSGAGERGFCAGADINEFGGGQAGDSLDRNHDEAIRAFPTPILAKVQGYCLGGGFETALSADFRFAGGGSTFGSPRSTSASSRAPAAPPWSSGWRARASPWSSP